MSRFPPFTLLLGFLTMAAVGQQPPSAEERDIAFGAGQVSSDPDGRILRVATLVPALLMRFPHGADRAAILRHVRGWMYAKATCDLGPSGAVTRCRIDRASAVGRDVDRAVSLMAAASTIVVSSARAGPHEVEFLAADGRAHGDRLFDPSIIFAGAVTPAAPPPADK